MTDNNQESGISRVEKRLYGSRAVSSEKKRAELAPLSYDVESVFEGTGDISKMKKEKDIQTPVLKTLLVVSAIFFLSALGISAYFLIGGSNIVSTDNIDLSVFGPVSIKGGEELNLQILISNKNNTPLKFAELIVEYPEGSRIPKNGSTVSNRYVKELGAISHNSVVSETAKSVLFGEENSEQEIRVILEYRTEGSNATFVKQKVYKTFISSSPLSLSLDLPLDTSSGKEIDLSIKVGSNSSETLKDIVLEMAYPPGFIFKDASPSVAYGDNLWVLGDLLAKGERSIHLRGYIQGADGEMKTFRASVGTRGSKDDSKVTILYGSSLKSLVVKKPFIGIGIALNGDIASSDYVANSREVVRGDISWTNNLPVKVLNGELSVKITGEVLNKSSVSASQGFFRSADGVIIWDRLNGNFPQSIEPGQSGSQSFSFTFLPLIGGRRAIIESPWLNLEATFKGTRIAPGGESESIVLNTVSRKIKLSSDLQLGARAVYYVGPFKNTGPLPPVSDKETTYTIIWSVLNSSNDVEDVVVKAALPSYVRWIGKQDDTLTYSSLGGEIIWKVGDVPAGSGVITKGHEVAFQVGLTPSISQVGQFPVLISDTLIFGNDVFTGVDTRSVRRSLGTQLSTDLGLRQGEDGAVK